MAAKKKVAKAEKAKSSSARSGANRTAPSAIETSANVGTAAQIEADRAAALDGQDRVEEPQFDDSPQERTAAILNDAVSDEQTIFTAVCRNGIEHRRNGIVFGAEPVVVDVSPWNRDQRERFYNDTFLMIIPGRHLNAANAQRMQSRVAPASVDGAGENLTPAMQRALRNGDELGTLAMRSARHPSAGPGSGVTARPDPSGARDLERVLNES